MTNSEIRIQKALKGEISTSKLNAEEQRVFFEEFAKSMWEKTPEQEAAFQTYIAKN